MVSYGFSISELLSSIDFTFLTLATFFVMLFAVFYLSLSKIFKGADEKQNKTISAIVSIGLALMVVFWVARSGFSIANFWDGLGISTDVLYVLLPIIIKSSFKSQKQFIKTDREVVKEFSK